MMEVVKCTCGHVNPVGTFICESCGKPLDKESQGFLNMRYEGMARRSLLQPQGVLDYLWKFFSSVRNAVWMIIITLLASIIGTIFPQERFYQSNLPPEQFYPQTYGKLGEIYYKMGFHNLYSSWWYILLLLMIGVSLVVCSIDRVIPLYRALNKQRIPKHLDFYRRQRIYTEGLGDQSAIDRIDVELKKLRYQTKRNEHGLLAEKGRFSRWGPYIVHIGLILFILAVMLRLVPGFYFESFVWVWEGETKKIPNTQYYVKNEDFLLEVYGEDEFPEKLDINGAVVKNFQTNAILYESVNGELVEVHRDEIRVNHPLEYKGLKLYQSGNMSQQVNEFNLSLMDKKNNKEIGQFSINLYDPPTKIELGNGYTVTLLEYYPDFALDDNKKPITLSKSPNRPAFIFGVRSSEILEQEKSWLVTGMDLDQLSPNNRYSIDFRGADFSDRSGLSVMIDRGLPVVYGASFIIMVGLVMGFYFQHRRVWVRAEGDSLFLAAHTNKNWFGLRRELEKTVQAAKVNIPLENMDKGVKHK